MVARNMFNMTAIHEKGHTHNILDQCYGIIARCFQSVDSLEDGCLKMCGLLREQLGFCSWTYGDMMGE
jgi:hypothetical protein